MQEQRIAQPSMWLLRPDLAMQAQWLEREAGQHRRARRILRVCSSMCSDQCSLAVLKFFFDGLPGHRVGECGNQRPRAISVIHIRLHEFSPLCFRMTLFSSYVARQSFDEGSVLFILIEIEKPQRL